MKVCEQCGRRFKPQKHASRQKNCGRKSCRLRRRRQWQKDRMEHDPDYRGNQLLAAKQWRGANSGYWQAYRQARLACPAKNRVQQVEQNRRIGHTKGGLPDSIPVQTPDREENRPSILEPVIAKMGEVVQGMLELIRCSGQTLDMKTIAGIAKMGDQNPLESASHMASVGIARTVEPVCKDGRAECSENGIVSDVFEEFPDLGW